MDIVASVVQAVIYESAACQQLFWRPNGALAPRVLAIETQLTLERIERVVSARSRACHSLV